MSDMVNTTLKIWAETTFHFDMHYAVLSGVLSCTESSKDQYAVHKGRVPVHGLEKTYYMRNSCLLL